MNIETAKSIRLIDFMASLGYKPVRRSGQKYFYLSPFRNEKEPSFNINAEKNLWFDFGEDKGGGIIELCKILYNEPTVSGVLHRLSIGRWSSCAPKVDMFPWEKPTNPMTNVRFSMLENKVLLRYINCRGITSQIAQKYCEEIHYERNGKEYYAVAFKSLSGGCEMRNELFKSCMGRKDISYFTYESGQRQQHLCVFEGFMDFLSYKVIEAIETNPLCLNIPCDYVVLNSVTNKRRFVSFAHDYKYIHCYLDNDRAGHDTVKFFEENCIGLIKDESGRYQDFKDVNDYLMKKPL